MDNIKRKISMRVKITGASKNTEWYRDRIGEEFEVTPTLGSPFSMQGFDHVVSSGSVYSGLYIKSADFCKAEVVTKTESKNGDKLIRRFPSGAVRSSSEGRPRPDWISPYAIEEVAKLLGENANDFGGSNYLLGIPEEACMESLDRHILELREALAITNNPVEARKAARSVAFNAIAMLHTMVLREKDLYVERFEKTELVTVDEAKASGVFVEK